MGTYAAPADLRGELSLDIAALPDATANALIADAEDFIDAALGARRIDDTTGRKVVQADVDAWRWTKLTRATVKAAAAEYRQPGTLGGRQWSSVSGPDFSFSGPVGATSAGITQSLRVLTQSGLRRLTTTTTRRTGRPPWDDFAINRDADY